MGVSDVIMCGHQRDLLWRYQNSQRAAECLAAGGIWWTVTFWNHDCENLSR